MLTDEQVAWDRLPRETARDFHYFCHYRDLGDGRSLLKAWLDHQRRCLQVEPTPRRRCPKRLETRSRLCGWVQRAELRDRDIERQTREKAAKELVDCRIRQLRLIQAQMQSASVTARIVLEAVADPTQLPKLVAEARGSSRILLDHLDRASRNAHATVSLVECERLILGLSTQSIELDDKRTQSIGDRVPEDPRRVELAIALLDLDAGTGPGSDMPDLKGQPG